MDVSRIALIVALVLFVAFVVYQVRPLGVRASGQEARRAKKIAREAGRRGSPEERARTLFEAATVMSSAGRPTHAAAYVGRALRSDAHNLGLVDEAIELFKSRPRLLAMVLVRRMNALGDGPADRRVYAKMALALATAWRSDRRLRVAAPMIERLGRLEAASDVAAQKPTT